MDEEDFMLKQFHEPSAIRILYGKEVCGYGQSLYQRCE